MLRRGAAGDVISALLRETGAAQICWNRLYDPADIARDSALKTRLTDDGIAVTSCPGNLAFEPWSIRTGADGPYRVFTPFLKACLAAPGPDSPFTAPKSLTPPATWPASDDPGTWGLLPVRPDWAGGLRDSWRPGEAGAAARLATFLDERLPAYARERDRPDIEATSRLSPHLHFGEISARQVWHAIGHAEAAGVQGTAKFRAELVWREFSHHLLYHFPDLPARNWRDAFDAFPWLDDADGFRAWCRGRTGYPLVDAGMRELWTTGYMHNRVRMVAASFLVKHLLIDWRRGADWFMDTLVDADLANNSASWQWVAGSGADAAPYFRIFNPVKQGERFDPEGAYVRRWVPELARLPDRYIHAPWTAPATVLSEAGVVPGRTYPVPCVDHATARNRALAAYEKVKVASQN